MILMRVPQRTQAIFATCMLVAACASEPAAPIQEPPDPPDSPPPLQADVAGTYEASQLIVSKTGSSRNLIGDPDTRISLYVNKNGATVGQLKIGADPDLRTKVPLEGRWRLIAPDRLRFEFIAETFLDEITFSIHGSTLSGEWALREEVTIRVTLQRLTRD